ncbi:MAG: radical SAM protein [Persephonella sp.]|nr:MAG: radical SAM protein [Persephonella sp.]RUM60565.1 MAG: radical SAM protein [Persephonella sp.]
MDIIINLIHYPVYTLGVGKRIGVWFQGCSIKCKGCMSKYTWKFDKKYVRDVNEVLREILSYPSKNITISGGEPFDQPKALEYLLKKLKLNGFKDILVYTGYEYEEIKDRYKDILKYIDVLISGRFVEGLETEYIWKGSDNQKMYIFNKKLEKIYNEYRKKKKNKHLQIVEKNSDIYILGIPYQKDIKEILDELM